MTAIPASRRVQPAAGTAAYWRAFDPAVGVAPRPSLWRRHCDAINADRALPISQCTEEGATSDAPRVRRINSARSGSIATTAKSADVSMTIINRQEFGGRQSGVLP